MALTPNVSAALDVATRSAMDEHVNVDVLSRHTRKYKKGFWIQHYNCIEMYPRNSYRFVSTEMYRESLNAPHKKTFNRNCVPRNFLSC